MLGGIISVSYNDSFDKICNLMLIISLLRIMYQKYQGLMQGHLVVSIAYACIFIRAVRL